MKTLRALVILLALASGAGAESSWNVLTEMLVVRVPQESGLRLRPRLRDAHTVEAGVAELRKLIASGKATLIGAPVLWSTDGQRTVLEEIEEIRYAVDFDFRGCAVFERLVPAPPPPRAFGPLSPYQEIDVPVAFELRNTGLTLELETTVSADGRVLAIAVVPQHVAFEGWQKFISFHPHADNWLYVQPLFKTLRTTTALDVAAGTWRMLNISVIPGTEPMMEFFLLRATTRPLLK
ncbi:MAG: hypothetical protein K8R23_11925 [Chthoniobacter sp.]|nr:hypothetical protein [Chthoniobacter sp.]